MSRSKAKGTAFETAVCRFLAEEGFVQVERRALSGTSDRGDIAGIPGWVLVSLESEGDADVED